MTFDSFYWYAARPASAELQHARERLAAGPDRAAFEQLLRSGDPVGVAIALDHFRRADGATRFGTTSPFERYRDEVVAAARAVLRSPPSPEGDDLAAGANHMSALGALMNLAEPEDAALVTGALKQATSSELRLLGAAAAATLLEHSAVPDEKLIAVLEAIAADTAASRDARDAAVTALGLTRSPAATRALLRILESPDLSLQITAALHLLDSDRDAHRARVEQVARTWPDPPPYPGNEVLELLAGNDAP